MGLAMPAGSLLQLHSVCGPAWQTPRSASAPQRRVPVYTKHVGVPSPAQSLPLPAHLHNGRCLAVVFPENADYKQ